MPYLSLHGVIIREVNAYCYGAAEKFCLKREFERKYL